MKKNVFALSIAAAVAGMTGAAHAITTVVPPLADQISAASLQNIAAGRNALAAATALSLSPSGVGHILVVPYYTTQSGNSTLLNLVNTDTINGKAVKVRFRGAANSDDVYDFQVFLSPSDVWTANISTGANGLATIVTADATCTKPSLRTVQPFSTLRVDPTKIGDALANETREGYVEIFNMGDIAPNLIAGAPAAFIGAVNPLYTAIKHVNNVAPCTGANFVALDTEKSTLQLQNLGLTAPTTGLAANWIIINQTTAAAYGAAATAIQGTVGVDGVSGIGNTVYWPQTNAVFTNWPSSAVTADPLLAGNLDVVPAIVPAVLPLLQDLPDLSTPYTTAVGGAIQSPVEQVIALSASISATSVSNEFLVDSATLQIGAATDFVFSMPTRRYSVALNYLAAALPTYNTELASVANSPRNFFTSANTTVSGRKVCVFNIAAAAWNQEETPEPTVIASPQPTPLLCGETSVMAINQTNPGVGNPSRVLGATVAVQGLSSAFNAGWYRIATPGLGGRGLPVLGSVFYKAASGNSNFGVNLEHRYTRQGGF